MHSIKLRNILLSSEAETPLERKQDKRMPTIIAKEEINGYMQTAIEIAKEAGKVIHAAFLLARPSYECKDGGQNDLVTETDKMVEQLVFNRLKAHYPTHSYHLLMFFVDLSAKRAPVIIASYR